MSPATTDSTGSRRTARATFGPVVLAGLVGAGAAAVAGHRQMLTIPESSVAAAGGLARTAQDRSVEFPLAGALALVMLACWGVLLVTRGRVRRVIAALSAVASLGAIAVVIVGGFVQDDDAAGDLAVRLGLSPAEVDVERGVWLWVCLAGALLALAAAVAAVRYAPAWPEMGSRYDAPTGSKAATHTAATTVAGDPSEQSNLDLWKSLDEGTDPTADDADASD